MTDTTALHSGRHQLRPRPGHGRAAGGRSGPVGLPRLLPAHDGEPGSLRGHLDDFGPPPYPANPARLIAEAERAGLTGRGGAAFPTYRKLAAVRDHAGRAVVIGNGAEGEPASSKDKTLLWISPHLVLDGLQLAAAAVGAEAVGLYLHRSARLHQHLHRAIAQRVRAGIDQATVELIEAPPRFLAGEESALAARVGGGPAVPRFRPPRIFERGVAGRPTLVQNVETLAHLALIARFGAGWFRAAGTRKEPGSMLATLHRAGGRTEVVEVPLGIGLGALAGLAPGSFPAGGPPGTGSHHDMIPLRPWPGTHAAHPVPVQAVLVGGYHGAWLPAAEAARLSLSNESLRPAGAAVGAGVVAALPADRCGLAETARVARYLALESAGQCGPCFNGLPRIADALAALAGPRPAADALAGLQRWPGLVEGRGACHHPDGTSRFVRSALRVFAAEITRHGRGECSGREGRPFLPLPALRALDESDWI